jgi:hypothetical protein
LSYELQVIQVLQGKTRMKQVDKPSRIEPASAPKLPWVTPRIEKMKAGDAENSFDPIIPDGPLSFGS